MLVFSGFCGGYGLLFWGCILDWRGFGYCLTACVFGCYCVLLIVLVLWCVCIRWCCGVVELYDVVYVACAVWLCG